LNLPEIKEFSIDILYDPNKKKESLFFKEEVGLFRKIVPTDDFSCLLKKFILKNKKKEVEKKSDKKPDEKPDKKQKKKKEKSSPGNSDLETRKVIVIKKPTPVKKKEKSSPESSDLDTRKVIKKPPNPQKKNLQLSSASENEEKTLKVKIQK